MSEPGSIDEIVTVSEVAKSFGDQTALAGVSFAIRRGQIIGLLGPNGAGKTTLLRILTTVIDPDSGDIAVGGHSVVESPAAVRSQLGVCPQELAVYLDLTGRENVEFFARLGGLDRRAARAKALSCLELVGLADRSDSRAGGYSGGMKRRLNIAIALATSPQLLLLDEPTAGVDPQSRNRIFDLIEELNAAGTTVVYTTHYMEEADRLCDYIVIMDHGLVLKQGTPRELKSDLGDPASVSLEDVFLSLTGRSLRA